MQAAEKAGASRVWGKPIDKATGICHPVVFDNISRSNPAYHDEFFAPVFKLFRFQTDEEAV